MSDDFTFDQKTGELRRGDLRLPLCRLHADIFALHYNLPADAPPLTTDDVAARLHIKHGDVIYALRCMKPHLRQLGLALAASGARGRRLIVSDMPKWAPTIPPPAEIPFQ